MTLATSNLAALAVTQIVQVSLVALAVRLAVRLFCRHRPHLAYALWLVVLVKCVTPPLWSSPTGLFSWAQLRVEAPYEVTASDPQPLVIDALSATPHVIADAKGDDKFSVTPAVSVGLVFLTVWLCGVCVLSSIVFRKWLQLWRTVHLTTDATGKAKTLAADLRSRLGVRRDVRVRVTNQPLSPAVFGLYRPVVIMPALLVRDGSKADLEPIVAHELVHIRRQDSLVAALQVIVQILWWFHPLVWWANRQITRERERSCDEEVVASLRFSPSRYAQSLLGVLQTETKLGGVFALPGVDPMEITANRLEHIMKYHKRFHCNSPRWCWFVLLTAGVLVLPGAGLTLEGSTASAVQSPADDRHDNAAGQNAETDREALTAAKTLKATITRNDNGEVIEVSVVNRPITDRELVNLKELDWSKSRSTRTFAGFLKLVLPALELKNSQLTDAHLVHLNGLVHLRTLRLWRNKDIAGSGLVHLKGMVNLETLFLDGTQVSDNSLKHIKGLTSLKDLQLKDTAVKDEGLAHLKGLKSLERLDLGNTGITSLGLEHLKGLANLNLLNLWGAKVTDAGLEHLDGLTSLEVLILRDTNVKDAGLVHLKDLTNLKGLNLWGTKVTDAGLKHLQSHNLDWLLVNNTAITDAGLAHLKELKTLKRLDLRDTGVSKEAVDGLQEALPGCQIHFR